MIAIAINIMSTWWYPRNGISPIKCQQAFCGGCIPDVRIHPTWNLCAISSTSYRTPSIVFSNLPLPSSLGATLESQPWNASATLEAVSEMPEGWYASVAVLKNAIGSRIRWGMRSIEDISSCALLDGTIVRCLREKNVGDWGGLDGM